MNIITPQLVHSQRHALRELVEQRQRLAASRSDLLAASVTLQRELDDVTKAHESLDAQCRELSALVKTGIDVIHSRAIDALPHELLRAVFIEFVTQDDNSFKNTPGYGSLLRMLGPFVLASVCRTWRQVALQYQELWSFIVIPSRAHTDNDDDNDDDDDDEDDRFEDHITHAVNIMLARSGCAPLDIIISWSKDSSISFGYHLMLNQLCATHLRWRRVYYSLPRTAERSDFAVFRLAMPMLEELYVPPLPSFEPPGSFGIPCSYFPDRSRLRIFSCFNRGLLKLGKDSQFTRLTSLLLEVQGVAATIVWSMLQECASTLVKLSLGSDGRSPNIDSVPSHPLTMVRLRSLTVKNRSQDLFSSWGDRLLLPNLHVLRLISCSVLQLQTFLRSACPAISVLRLNSCGLTKEDAPALLPLSQICGLTISNDSLANLLLTLVRPIETTDEGPRWLFPLLETLEVSRHDVYVEVLLRVLQARHDQAGQTAAIKHIHDESQESSTRDEWAHLMLVDQLRQSSKNAETLCSLSTSDCSSWCDDPSGKAMQAAHQYENRDS